jgi:hypothetical protein
MFHIGLVQHVVFDIAALLRIEDLLLELAMDLQGQRNPVEQRELLRIGLQLFVFIEPAFDLAVVPSSAA